MTRDKLEERVKNEVKDEVMREKFLSLLWQGFKIKRVLEMLNEYLKETTKKERRNGKCEADE